MQSTWQRASPYSTQPNPLAQSALVAIDKAPIQKDPQMTTTVGTSTSTKSFTATWLLALLLGTLGIDRFYLGKVGTGILKLVTIGGLGLWTLIDLIMVLAGATRDKQGLLLERPSKPIVPWIISAAVLIISPIISFSVSNQG